MILTTSDGAEGCPGDTHLTLVRHAGEAPEIVTQDDDGGVAPCSLIEAHLDAGTYEIEVRTSDGVALPDYVLTVEIVLAALVGEACDPEAVGPFCPHGTTCGGENADAPICAPVCGDGLTIPPEECDDGNLEPDDGCSAACLRESQIGDEGGDLTGGFEEDESQTFTLSLRTPGWVSIETSDGDDGCPGDTILEIYRVELPDGPRTLLASNDDGGEGLCSLLGLRLPVGQYEIKVRGYMGQAIDEVVVSVRIVPLVGLGESCDPEGRVAACGDGTTCDPLTSGGPVCVPICGDGVRLPGERCDDGNGINGDGCDALCQPEGGVAEGGDFAGDLEPGEIDRFPMSLDFPSYTFIETSDGAEGCPGDTLITVVAVDWVTGEREVVISDDNSGAEGGCSQITHRLEAGDYEVEVAAVGDAAIGAYILDVMVVPNVSEGGSGHGGFGAQGSDRYLVRLETAATVTAETGDGTGGCPGDTRLFLVRIDLAGADREEIADDDDGGPGLCSRLSARLPAGDYEIVVDGFGGRAVPAYIIDVSIRREPDVGAGGDFGGMLPAGGEAWYALSIDEPARITATTSDGAGGCPGDTELQLLRFDSEIDPPTMVDQNNDGPDVAPCSRLEVDAEPGHYRLVVRNLGDVALDPYTLTVGF